MPTIIDSLILAVKLDPSNFKKGAAEVKQAQEDIKQTATADATSVEKSTKRSGKATSGLSQEQKKRALEERKRQQQAARDLKNRETQEKKYFDTVTGGLKSIGLFAAGAVLGFEGLKGAIQAYSDASAGLTSMNRIAPTIGTNIKELDVLGNALKQVGGKSEDAAADLAKLGHAQFSLLMHQPDAMAGFARRMGVGLFNADGTNRDKVEILKDIGDKLRAMTPDVQAQAMYAREMGLSEATIQLYVIKTAAAREEILKNARLTAKADEEGAAAAEKRAQQHAKLSNAVGGRMNQLAAATSKDLGNIEEFIANMITGYKGEKVSPERLAAARAAQKSSYGNTNKQKLPATKFDSQFAAIEKKYGLPAGILKSIANTESHFDPKAVNKKTGATGLMQLMPKYFPGAGQDPNKDIDTAGKELASLIHKYGSVEKALAAYNGGQGNLDKRGGNIANMKPETQAYVPKVMGALDAAKFAAGVSAPAGGSGGAAGAAGAQGGTVINNNTTIGEINIETQAKDAEGIASNLPDALKRKGVVAQANTGMN